MWVARSSDVVPWRMNKLLDDREGKNKRRLGKQENVLTIDLAQELEKNSDFFYDGTHFTNAGAAEVAKIIYKRLLPYLMQTYRSFSNIREKEINTATR